MPFGESMSRVMKSKFRTRAIVCPAIFDIAQICVRTGKGLLRTLRYASTTHWPHGSLVLAPPNVVYNRLAISPLGENQRPKRFQRQGELAALTRMQCIASHLFSNYTLDTKPRAQTRNTPHRR